jgi:hypothetical protein
MIWPIFELCNRHIALPKAGLNGFDWTLVQDSTFVLRLNFSAKNPHLRQYSKRYASPYPTARTNFNRQQI